MYPYLRAARVLAGALIKLKLDLDDASEMRLRVRPNDIDAYPEMNNGRWFHFVQEFIRRKQVAAQAVVRAWIAAEETRFQV
jgi:acyl-ACP thioesterase